jgi:hypothetical protein
VPRAIDGLGAQTAGLFVMSAKFFAIGIAVTVCGRRLHLLLTQPHARADRRKGELSLAGEFEAVN